MRSLTVTVLTTETKEYKITVTGATDEESREIIQDAIEGASDIHNAVQCIMDEGTNEVELDAGRQVGYELEVTGTHQYP